MTQKRHGVGQRVGQPQSGLVRMTYCFYLAVSGEINAWSRELAVDLSEYGTLANVVTPGCTLTEITVIDGGLTITF